MKLDGLRKSVLYLCPKMVALFILAAVALDVSAAERSVTITDVAGRKVAVDVPIERAILGEGVFTFALAILDRDDPFRRIIGWRDDLKKHTPLSYALYAAKYPKIDDIPTFGGMYQGNFDLEKAISLHPDVILMNLWSKTAIEDGGVEQKLTAAGIPLIYIDFGNLPMKNTEPSMRILGRLTGHEDRAEEFIEFRADHIRNITGRLQKARLEMPDVFIERFAGRPECCASFGDANFGRMVSMAGGRNIAADIISSIPKTGAAFGTINLERIIASDPDQYVGTSTEDPPSGWISRIEVGPGVDMRRSRQNLIDLMNERPGFDDLEAVKNGHVHAIWHQFYDSPYNFIAIERMAKWFHPDLFADIDPEASFRELYARFLPIDYHEGYFISIEGSIAN